MTDLYAQTGDQPRSCTYRTYRDVETVTGLPLWVAEDTYDGVVGYAYEKAEAINNLCEARRAVDRVLGKEADLYAFAELTTATWTAP